MISISYLVSIYLLPLHYRNLLRKPIKLIHQPVGGVDLVLDEIPVVVGPGVGQFFV